VHLAVDRVLAALDVLDDGIQRIARVEHALGVAGELLVVERLTRRRRRLQKIPLFVDHDPRDARLDGRREDERAGERADAKATRQRGGHDRLLGVVRWDAGEAGAKDVSPVRRFMQYAYARA